MDKRYKIEFPEDKVSDGDESSKKENAFQNCMEMMMNELDLEIDKSMPEGSDMVSFEFPKEIQSDVGRLVLTIDFLTTWSGKSISDLLHLEESEMSIKVSLESVMRLVPEKEMDFLGIKLQSPLLQRVHREVKLRVFDEWVLMRWKERLRGNEMLRIDKERVVVDPIILHDEWRS